MLDFNDLLSRTRQLLTAPSNAELREQLSSSISLLLVDEFQDTDPLQVELVRALAGAGLTAGKLFFVGDYKQSIYRFRGADPQVFHSLRQQTPQAGQQSLSKNFRSQPAILSFVNALFREELGPDYEPLRPHRAQVSPEPAVEFLWVPGADDSDERVGEMRAREADWVARRIRQILDKGEAIVWDAKAAAAGKPQARPAELGDFAILFRSLPDVEAYETALRTHDIDYYLVGGHAFYAQQEIYDVLNLLRAVCSATDVVSLLGTLRSGFFSLADETLFWLAQHPQGIVGGLSAADPPAALDERSGGKFGSPRAPERTALCKDRLPVSELIEVAFARTGYDAAVLNEFLGERKLANLLKLIEQARTFDRAGFFGLPDFIAQLAEFVVAQPNEPLAATQAEDSHVVRLMTIHQAKGLEFPIVIVPDINRKPKPPGGDIQFDHKLGPLVRLREAGKRPQAVTGYDLWKNREEAEDAAERNRLLYVAATRAADYLMLSGSVEHVGDAEQPWTKLLARRFDLATGKHLGSLPSDATAPQVRVTAQQPDVATRRQARRERTDVADVVAQVEQAAAGQSAEVAAP